MKRTLSIVTLLLLFCASNAFAGFGSSFYSSGYGSESGTLIAAVQIKDKGVYNLIVRIEFLRKPQYSKVYKSDEYEKLIGRLSVESRGIALQKILDQGELAISDLSKLKKDIEAEINALSSKLKKKILPDENIEIVFSISDMFLLEPTDE